MSARQGVLLALLALAEASVIEPLILLMPTPLRLIDSGGALAATWVLLCAIAFSRRGMAQRDARWGIQRIVLGAWLVGLLIVFTVVVILTERLDPRSLSVLFIEFVSVMLLWWRGVALGGTDFLPNAARLRLQVGLLLFVMFALATVFDPTNNLLVFILPFLVGALFAMPLSHLERVEQSTLGRHVAMDMRWWRTLAMSVGAPLFTSIAVAMLITGDTIASGLRLLVAVILVPIIAIAFVVAYILSLIVSLLFGKALRDPMASLQGLSDFMNSMNSRPDTNTASAFTLPPELRFALGLAAVAVIIGIVLWLTERARRQAAQVRAEQDDLQDLGDAYRPPEPRVDTNPFRSLSLRRWLAALSIRRIYARMMHEAGKRGFARLPAQTPYDYMPRLMLAFPGADMDVRTITDAYIAAHYGEVPDTREALDQIRMAWERVRATERQTTERPAKETTE